MASVVRAWCEDEGEGEGRVTARVRARVGRGQSPRRASLRRTELLILLLIRLERLDGLVELARAHEEGRLRDLHLRREREL